MSERLAEWKKAQIVEVDERGKYVPNGAKIDCLFNPYEYTVSKSNTYERKPKNNADVMHAEFKESGSQTLKLSLFFDSYEENDSITEKMKLLWSFMSVSRTDPKGSTKQKKETKKQRPPYVAFEWGIFSFVAVITEMTQKFTLFKPDGTPVRATVDVTFVQFNDVDDYNKKARQNPTSGGGPVQRVREVLGGDRLDLIAYQEYGDSGKWREIAEKNRLRNLHDLRSGQWLVIPDLSAEN